MSSSKALWGFVSNHEHIADHTQVCTSRVIDADFASHIVETKNTVYELGEPDSIWVRYLTDEQKKEYAIV